MSRLVTIAFLMFVTVGLLGCGSPSVSSYHPQGGEAKAALTAALDAWKSGREKPGTLDGQKPAVQVQDSIWESGRKLKEFQIGDEQPSAEGPTRFSVQLTFDGAAAAEKVEYVVFGKDPLWVARDADYRRMTGQ